MNRLNSNHCTLSICLAATLLAACGGSQQAAVVPILPAQKTATLPQTSAGSFRGEEFTAKAGLLQCHELRWGHYVDFSVSGNASGPFPGSFTASGNWGWKVAFGPSWGFNET